MAFSTIFTTTSGSISATAVKQRAGGMNLIRHNFQVFRRDFLRLLALPRMDLEWVIAEEQLLKIIIDPLGRRVFIHIDFVDNY